MIQVSKFPENITLPQGGAKTMKKILSPVFAAAFAVATLTSAPANAGHNGGAIIAGVVVGAILGGALGQDHGPVYAAPVYVAPQPVCQIVNVFTGYYQYGQPVYQQQQVCQQAGTYSHNGYGHGRHYDSAYGGAVINQTGPDTYRVNGRPFYRTCTKNLVVVPGLGAGCWHQ